jgi:hypothetical protein
MSMRPWIKKRWVEVLRYGDYKQAREELCAVNRSGFCCLGVLTDLYAKEHGLEFTHETQHLKHAGGDEYLSSQVMRWAGLEDHDPRLSERGMTLSELNDSKDWEGNTVDFNAIADAIEKSDL